jgi:hypothetical protein
MWPLAWSINNFPPALRDKMHFGLHLASFDTGSEAALILFSRDLEDLWQHPIQCSRTRKLYRVVLMQLLADGPGLCKITHTTGASAYHGCNLCDFSGERFGKGICFDRYRRYLNMTHPYRRNNNVGVLQFNGNETGNRPVQRSYDSYHESAVEAKATKETVDGVKGVWAFDILPYRHLIVWGKDPMHAFNNAITDAIRCITPTSKSGYVKRENRTEKKSTRQECKKRNYHDYLWEEETEKDSAPWSLSVQDCIRIDSKMHAVIGANHDEVPMKVMKRGHADKTHSTIFWASTYAPGSLSGEGSRRHTDNVLQLFDIISQLNGSRHKVEGADILLEKLINNLVEKSGLFPGCECTTALHELIHICEQIPITGTFICLLWSQYLLMLTV